MAYSHRYLQPFLKEDERKKKYVFLKAFDSIRIDKDKRKKTLSSNTTSL
jgi:hypothetical protein